MLQSPLSRHKTVQAYLAKSGIRLLLAILAVAWTLSPSETIAAQRAAGQWQEKTEIVWDAGAAKLVRRSLRIWDAHPELGLEFHWSPADESGIAAGAVSGSGELIWYRRCASPYDYGARYSTYKGTLKNGRPDGWGKLSVRSGFTYEGSWKDGRMDGEGAIEYGTGDRYRGRFIAGKPDGSGTYIVANGDVVEGSRVAALVAKASARLPFGLSPLSSSPPTVQAAPLEVAQNTGLITMSLYTDQAKNTQFKEGDPEMESYVYGETKTDGTVQIGLDAPEIVARWKGDGTITADENTMLLEPAQFAPAFLVVDVVNNANRDAQIVGGYIDVAESDTDWEPYLEITSVSYYKGEDAFDPTFTFVNDGWGPVQNAKVTYSFGQQFGGGSQTFVIDAGTFDQAKEVSTLPGFQGSGVDVSRLKEARYPCPSYEQVPACLTNLVRTGLFGQIGQAVYSEDKYVYVKVSGVIDYDWADAQGNLQHRQSPISVKLPVLAFVVGPVAEYGAPEAVSRKLPSVMLGLDARNYRIPFSYRERLKAQEDKRFALTLDAARSSHHQFKIVLQLADGSIVATPQADLLLFKPRAKLY